MRKGRLGYVDGLRALAALEVVACHTALAIWPAWGNTHPIAVLAPLVWLTSFGHGAVAVFIVLSGYSLMLPVARSGSLRAAYGGTFGFYKRRARRILPPYYLALALSLVLAWATIQRIAGVSWGVALPVVWPDMIQHLLLVQDFSATFDDYTINHVFWSIALECQIYVLFPLFLVLWRRYHPLLGAAILLAVGFGLTGALLFTWIGHIPLYDVAAVAPQFVGLFGLGMLAATWTTSTPKTMRGVWSVYWWWGVAIVCFGVMITCTTVSVALMDYVTGFGTLATLRAAHLAPTSVLRRALEWRPLTIIGGFSYSIYLVHAPLIQIAATYLAAPLRLGDAATYLLLLLVGAPLIVVCAWGFYWLCERPFLNARPATIAIMATATGQERAAGHLSGGSEVARPLSV